jgi:hypothetical protein
MQLLEYFYDRNNEITTYHQRKFTIPSLPKLLIFGAPASGKSSMVLDYLMALDSEDFLYIDFRDPKFLFRDMMEEDIEGFVEANGIKLVVLDHYEHGYFEHFPFVEELIVISDSYYDYGEGFGVLEVPLLDYEEFFSFQKRGGERQIFNLFLRQGTLPQLATYSMPKEQLFLNFLKTHFTDSEQRLLAILAHFNGAVVTTFQIYSYAKERYKISKDLIYKQIANFQARGVIYFISDMRHPKSKKLLFFDFALAKYLSLTQSFPKQFDTMVALSLLKHQIAFEAFGMMGYLTEDRVLMLPAPFESEESIWKRAYNRFVEYKKINLKRVYIITVAARFEFKIEHILFEALPFYEWVVINDGES